MKVLDPNEVQNMETLELLKTKEMLESVIETAETDILGIKNEIMERLKAKNLKSDKVDKWLLTRYTETRFKTTLEEARELGAVKTEEKVDTNILKRILKAGATIPGTMESERLRIAVVEENESTD